MFGESIGAMFLVALAPEAWVALAVIVAVSVVAQRRADAEDPPAVTPSRHRWLLELAPLVIVPTGLLIAAGLSDPEVAGEREIRTVVYVLVAIITVQMALGSGLIWRHRHRWLPTVAIAGGLCWWTLGVSFIAYMALTDDWL